MTQLSNNEKIELLKDTIIEMYAKQGYPKTRIAKLLKINRYALTKYLNDIWKIQPANFTHISKSKEKWINRHRNEIKSKLDQSIPIKTIAKTLGVSANHFSNTWLKPDPILNKAYNDYLNRIHDIAKLKIEEKKKKSHFNYNCISKPNEEWKPILGYENYYISNKGRVKKYINTNKSYILLTQNHNIKNQRAYIKIHKKGLQVSRLVGFAFVPDYDKNRNTIDHIDGNINNNNASNLRWVSQSENNKAAYSNHRTVNIAYSRHPKFKKIVIDKQYEFKTIRAFAKFYKVSESQAQRYLNQECRFDHTIKFYY